MQKNRLERFIQKYSLSGNVNSVKLSCKNNILTTSFITEDKSLLGNVSVKNFNFENADLGVYQTDQLSRLLSVLGDDIDLKLVKINDRAISLKMSDATGSVNFVLSDLSLVSEGPKLKNIPEYETEVNVDFNFISRFIKGKMALPEVDSFTIFCDPADTKIVIGHSSTNTNRVNMPLSAITTTRSSHSFNANLFRDILIANKESSSAKLKISDDGLLKIEFNIDDYNAVYYLVANDGGA